MIRLAIECSADQIMRYLHDYRYQPSLTTELDNVKQPFDHNDINRIVLWKVNRYVSFAPDLLNDMNSLVRLSEGQHREAESIVLKMLETHGVRLAMASTLLRFRNPKVFQIIDQRAFRVLNGKEFREPHSLKKKVALYFDYIDELLRLCKTKDIEFSRADRVLYCFDKTENKSFPIRN